MQISYINPKNMSLFSPHHLMDELMSRIISKHMSYKNKSCYPDGKAAEESKDKILFQYTLQLASYSTLYMWVYIIELEFNSAKKSCGNQRLEQQKHRT